MTFSKYLAPILLFPFFVFSQQGDFTIDGLAAIVDEHIILKSDVAQLVQMTALQQRINPQLEPERLVRLQDEVLQSMIDQKIILEMAKLDSIEVKDKEVEQALSQQIDNIVAQAGSEEAAEARLGQSLKSLRREYRQEMQERLISERYQQQLLSSLSISRQEVMDFFKTYKDSIPFIPTQIHLWHQLTLVEPGEASLSEALALITGLRERLINGEPFEDLAKAYSQDPGSAATGGNLGLVRRGSLVPEFETVAFTQEDGELSLPVKTQFGYHLIQTIEKQGEKAKLRHILIAPKVTEADESRAYNFAAAVRDSIHNIDDFARLAKHYSKDDQSRGSGGDLGWVNPQEFPIPEVAQIINYLEMNECSPPVKTNFGYHLFWIEETKVGGRPNLATHWSEIEAMALNYKKMNWYSAWIAKARQNFFVQIAE
ncbi:MAG: peptidylprolyl isomerase [Candidatus Neomarinimicrobiota bacterium]